MIFVYHLTDGRLIREDAGELGATLDEVLHGLSGVLQLPSRTVKEGSGPRLTPYISVRDMDKGHQVLIFTAQLVTITITDAPRSVELTLTDPEDPRWHGHNPDQEDLGRLWGHNPDQPSQKELEEEAQKRPPSDDLGVWPPH